MILTRLRSEGDLSNALGSTRLKSSSPTWTRKTSNYHYGHVTPRLVRAPGLHPPQNRPPVGRVPSPGVPISSIMRIAAERHS